MAMNMGLQNPSLLYFDYKFTVFGLGFCYYRPTSSSFNSRERERASFSRKDEDDPFI